jgi:hypothetical protein
VPYNGPVRVAVRFFSGVPHPHLLGVCCPTLFCGAGILPANLRSTRRLGLWGPTFFCAVPLDARPRFSYVLLPLAGA